VLLACIGGTLPAADLFERALGAKTLFFSFSTSDENLHAPTLSSCGSRGCARACGRGKCCGGHWPGSAKGWSWQADGPG